MPQYVSCKHICTNVCIHTYTHTHIHTCIHACMHKHRLLLDFQLSHSKLIHTCMHTYTYITYTHIHTHRYIQVHIHIHIRTHKGVYIYIHTATYYCCRHQFSKQPVEFAKCPSCSEAWCPMYPVHWMQVLGGLGFGLSQLGQCRRGLGFRLAKDRHGFGLSELATLTSRAGHKVWGFGVSVLELMLKNSYQKHTASTSPQVKAQWGSMLDPTS